MDKSERRSLGTISSLRSSKGAVLVNQNGSFAYVCPMKQESINVCSQDKTIAQDPQQVMLPVFGDDELAFYINPQDLPDFVDEVLDTYGTHSRVFLVFLGVQMIVEAMFDIMVYENAERIEKLLALIYNKVPIEDISQMIFLCLIVNILFYCLYYIMGIIGTLKQSYKLLNVFCTLSIFGIVLQILLSYTYQFNMLIFFFRIISYIYAKFLGHLILSLILLPH